jgi:hypothetical protein
MAENIQPLFPGEMQQMSEEKADHIEGSDNQNPSQSLPPPVPSEPNQPPANGYEARVSREKESCLEVTRFVVEIITLLVLSWYACTTQAQLNEARRANNTAYNALESVRENARLDQRAWVGPVGFSKSKIIPGAEVKMGVVIRNYGKTPALQLRGKIAGKSLAKGEEFIPSYEYDENITHVDSISTLFPNVSTSYDTSGKILDATQIESLRREENVLYVYGMVGYEDIFGVSHCTTFCTRLRNDLVRMGICPMYNVVTDTKCEEEKK